MNQMLFTVLGGTNQVFEAQAIHAHNLANISTIGYKADRVHFADVVNAQKLSTTHTHPALDKSATDMRPGSLISTGRNLDVAIKGEGWFVVATEEGTEAYTRDGNFKLDQNRVLRNSHNLPVIGNNGEISVPANAKVTIGTDGVVTATEYSSGKENTIIIDRLKLVNLDRKNIAKSNGGLFVNKDKSSAEADSKVTLTSGFLESSNVNAISEIMSMLSLARTYEIHLKLMNTAEENSKANNNVLA